ncbi:helix-turn-helix transcriptional regulator [Dactylosporangium sp. NPDC049140]|uniref:NACHT domain-containing protein n=1 Tax=Dactylosporangium sp. NPDC049140 TaxID=3155647 RepID=UPI0033E0ED83
MRRDPALSFRGALAILGHHEQPAIEKLDRLLGAVILGGGAAAVTAIAGVTAVPLALVTAVWGWVDQKNEAVRLLRELVDRVAGRLTGTAGYERGRLIAAAHTTIVIAAYFEALREHLGGPAYAQLRLTRAEQQALTIGDARATGASVYEALYSAEIPAPSPARGYVENLAAVRAFLTTLSGEVDSFLGTTAAWTLVRPPLEPVVDAALERYQSHYLALAAEVPEFYIWAVLGEHAATRAELRRVRPAITTAIAAEASALRRIETMLATLTDAAVVPDMCDVLRRANRGELSRPILTTAYGPEIRFPTVEQIYVNPRYRTARAERGAALASEAWWDRRPAADDLDLALAGLVMAPDAARLPLLVLGHPGAGKSLLTRVFASRLPAAMCTAVRVPLREVDADAPVVDQIQEALDRTTNHRVDWARLVEQSAATIRVVLLDGLDELLQATGYQRSGYLHEVMEFQRLEAEQDRPVVVVVTARTVTVDKLDLPRETPVFKIDDFGPKEIERWLTAWRAANTGGDVRALSLADALRQFDLTRQPLLLLMLALYCADPAVPPPDERLSTTELYEELILGLTRREIGRRNGKRIPGTDAERAVAGHLTRLSVAALAMFNRGRQHVTEPELAADLAALGDSPEQAAEVGRRLLGEFFFVHVAEAQQELDGRPVVTRAYEFLHATFGEYLVARRLTELLAGLPDEPAADLLFTLLCHAPLAVRRPILTFTAEMFDRLPETDCERVRQALVVLLASARERLPPPRYAGYRPVPVDQVRRTAAYCANLLLLRVLLSPDGAPATDLNSSVEHLWRAGLDAEDVTAVLRTLRRTGDRIRLTTERGRSEPALDPQAVLAALLRSERQEAGVTQGTLGHALGVGASLVSAWERGRAVPSPARLSDLARFFAGPSAEGLRSDADLTWAEQLRFQQLEAQFLQLAELITGQALPDSLVLPRRGPLRFPEGQPIAIVPGLVPGDVAFAEQDHVEHVQAYQHADLDALIDLYGHVRAMNPQTGTLIRSSGAVHSDDLTRNLLLIGNEQRNPVVQELMRYLDVPVPVELMAPVLEGTDGGRVLVEDVGLIIRGFNPFNRLRTAMIFAGTFGRGALGAVRALTDARFAPRNIEYLEQRFATADRFGLLVRVRVLAGEVLTPDLTNPANRLYEWPDQSATEVTSA